MESNAIFRLADEQVERMKELCKERNSLYEKQNDLKGQKQKIEKSWNDKKCGAWRLLCPILYSGKQKMKMI